MASSNNLNQTPPSNMTRLPSISSLMTPPQSMALQSPSHTPLSKTNRLPSYSPENTLAPISNLFAPESSRDTVANQDKTPDTVKQNILISPPNSPRTGKENASVIQEGPALKARDPVLFPSNEAESTVQPALFPSKNFEEDAITTHLAKSMDKFTQTAPPTREEYRLTIACVGRAYNKNPGAYMKRQREEEEDLYYKTKRLCAEPGQRYVKPVAKPVSKPVAIAPRPPRQPRKTFEAAPAAPIDRPRRTPKPTPRTSPELKDDLPLTKATARTKRTPATKVAARNQRTNLNLSPAQASVLEQAANYPQQASSVLNATTMQHMTPEQRAPVPKPNDKDYNSITDYAPPLSTLKDSPVALKTDWISSNPYNNSNDVDRHLLHESEVKVAEVLRLTCAQYLCSKRRIFEARLNALRVGKPFRKTDSQKACKIDVNKASKLFAAFEKVGWFDSSHFEKYL